MGLAFVFPSSKMGLELCLSQDTVAYRLNDQGKLYTLYSFVESLHLTCS